MNPVSVLDSKNKSTMIPIVRKDILNGVRPSSQAFKHIWKSKICSRRLSTTLLRGQNINNSSKKKLPAVVPLYKRTGKSILKYSLISALVGVSYVSYHVYRENNPLIQAPQSENFANGCKRKTLVILGSGWGSISLLKTLDTRLYNVVVVSPRNYFLFTPLLPSTPVGTVELKSIVEPVRSIARRSSGEVSYYEAEALAVDNNDKTVRIRSVDDENSYELDIKYDYLVMGVGAQPTTFNTPGVLEHSSFLKEISDAQEIRLKIMNSIERAALLPLDDPERKRLLSFVVVGGGPTGVEFAAELRDYIDQDLSKWVPGLSKEIKLTLVESTPNILGTFNQNLIDYAKDLFRQEKIGLKLKTRVIAVNDKNVIARHKDTGEEEAVSYGVLVWATGNAPREITKKLISSIEEQDSKRGLLIDEKLRLLGGDGSIYAIGDCTFHKGLFPTAQVAHQEGEYLADVFRELHEIDQLKYNLSKMQADPLAKPYELRRLQGKIRKATEGIKDFKYNHMGSLAYIGKEKAVADLAFGSSKYTSAGSFTFLFWKSAYLAMCLSFRNRLLVALDWAKVSFFGRDSSI